MGIPVQTHISSISVMVSTLFYESNNASGDIDKIIFGEGLNVADMTVTKDIVNNDIILSFTGGDSIRLKDTLLANDSSCDHKIEEFHFNDGTVLQYSDLTDLSITHGTDEGEIITGTNNDETIYAHSGNDKIYTYNGDDTIYAGDGNDTIDVGNGDNTVYADDGNDTVYGNNGNDIVYGGDGNDTIYAHYGNDTISGGRVMIM